MNRTYVAHDRTDSLSVIDRTTESVVDVVPLGFKPYSVAVNPVTNRLYVPDVEGRAVSVIDGDSNSVIATVPVGAWAPFGIAVNPVTNRIYVASFSTRGLVSAIDGDSNSELATIDVGLVPIGVDVNPSTDRVYVANVGSGNVSVIDGITNTVINTIPVDPGPTDVAVDPVTGRIYVGHEDIERISVIDGASDSVTGVISLNHGTFWIALNPSTGLLYVPHRTGGVEDSVTIIRGVSILCTLPMSGGPWWPAANASNDRVYVSLLEANAVAVIENSSEVCLPPAVGGIVELSSVAETAPASGGSSSDRDYVAPVAAGVAVAIGALLLGASGLYVVRMRMG